MADEIRSLEQNQPRIANLPGSNEGCRPAKHLIRTQNIR
jgi:hypothetical protein